MVVEMKGRIRGGNKMNILEMQEFEDFKGMYGSAKTALESDPFYITLLTECYQNQEYMTFIKLADIYLDVPPVKSFVRIYKESIIRHEQEISQSDRQIIANPQIRQALGSFFGFVFQKKYAMRKTRKVRVGDLGIVTASLFKQEA